MVLALGRIFCSNLEKHFCNGRLGKGYNGVTILDVFVKDSDAVMSNECWLISECKFLNDPSFQSTLDHFSQLPNDVDLQEDLGERWKTLYQFIMQKLKTLEKLLWYNKKTVEVEVRKVSSERCCSKHCCQTFPQAHTLTVCQIFYLKFFEERPEYGIALGGKMHFLLNKVVLLTRRPLNLGV